MRLMIKAALLFVTLMLALWGTFQFSSSTTTQVFGEIVPRVETSRKVVALTFDDGPTAEATDRILTTLRDRGVKGTFFLMGSELEKNPEAGKRIADEGHEIGNHSYSHKRMVLKTPSFIKGELESTDLLIRATGYEGPITFRPPYGKKLLILPYYLSQTGRKTIMWDVEPDSYADVAADSEKIVTHVMERVRPGSIIILHVMYKSRETSLNAVGGIIDGLKAQGYEFKTVSELLALR